MSLLLNKFSNSIFPKMRPLTNVCYSVWFSSLNQLSRRISPNCTANCATTLDADEISKFVSPNKRNNIYQRFPETFE